MKQLLFVFFGSGIGGLLRFLIGNWFTKYFHTIFPTGTLMVNIIACFLIGFLVGLLDKKLLISQEFKILLTVGFCGGFSTFSTFTNETISLINNQNFVYSFLYVFLSLFLCLGANFIGLYIGKM